MAFLENSFTFGCSKTPVVGRIVDQIIRLTTSDCSLKKDRLLFLSSLRAVSRELVCFCENKQLGSFRLMNWIRSSVGVQFCVCLLSQTFVLSLLVAFGGSNLCVLVLSISAFVLSLLAAFVCRSIARVPSFARVSSFVFSLYSSHSGVQFSVCFSSPRSFSL